MTEKQTEERNRLFQEATNLIKDEIPLHERPDMPKPGFWARQKLKKASTLLEQVLQTSPNSWSSMWFLGKIQQRFEDKAAALSWFEKAYQVNPSQSDVAREASMCAMDIGNHEAAIAFAFRGVQIEPNNAGLHANLALSYLLAGQISNAQASIDRSLALDSNDGISKTIQNIVIHFAANGRKPPEKTDDLLAYWMSQRKR